MSAVGLPDIPDTRTQQIKKMVKAVKETTTKTLDSFNKSTRTVAGQQGGYQIPFFSTYYSGNSAISPTSTGNSFRQSNPPETISMYVGLAYAFKVIQAQGMLLNDMNSKESLVSEMRLKKMAIEDFMKHQNYYAIGDGSGTVAVVTTVTGGVFTGTTAAATSPNQTKGAHRLRKGNTYDIIDESSGAIVGTITPTANGTRSATVACTSTGTPNNAGAYVVEQGHYNNVINGLGGLISNSTSRTFQGVQVTNIPEFINSAVDLNGSSLTSVTVNTLRNKVEVRNPDENGFTRIGHITPGLYNVLAIQGYGGRVYNAERGAANTSFGVPTNYSDGDISWVQDPDMDEDRVYLRTAGDFFNYEARPFGPVNEDGLDWRQNPGANDVGAWEYFKQVGQVYNLGFDGEASGGNDSSAMIIRSAVVNSQVNS